MSHGTTTITTPVPAIRLNPRPRNSIPIDRIIHSFGPARTDRPKTDPSCLTFLCLVFSLPRTMALPLLASLGLASTPSPPLPFLPLNAPHAPPKPAPSKHPPPTPKRIKKHDDEKNLAVERRPKKKLPPPPHHPQQQYRPHGCRPPNNSHKTKLQTGLPHVRLLVPIRRRARGRDTRPPHQRVPRPRGAVLLGARGAAARVAGPAKGVDLGLRAVRYSFVVFFFFAKLSGR